MHTFRQLLRTLFQGLYQTIMIFSESYWQTVLPTFQIFYHYQITLTFSESYWQTTLHTFLEFMLTNIDIFREFLPN